MSIPKKSERRDALWRQVEQRVSEARGGRVVFLTGAGISAPSGIPTFRGPEGYWTVGSRVYRPMELATMAAFREQPREVWRWYLHRKGVCNRAEPNAAHTALAELEAVLGSRFALITQNVDGLHLRAGNTLRRTFQIHGNTDYMRPLEGPPGTFPIPSGLPTIERDTPLDDATWARLVTPDGRRARPHVLWFDEYYDEAHFKAESALAAAAAADLLVVVGTAGATNLPHQCVGEAVRRGAGLVDINLGANPFGELAARLPTGVSLREPAEEAVPRLVSLLKD